MTVICTEGEDKAYPGIGLGIDPVVNSLVSYLVYWLLILQGINP